jgi:hypothetical protein
LSAKSGHVKHLYRDRTLHIAFAKVDGRRPHSVVGAEETNDREVLQKFQILPKLYAGRKVTVDFILGNIRSAFDEDCVALRLEHGATVTTPARIDASMLLNAHGERDIAVALTALARGSRVKAVANTAFGTYTQIIWSEEGEPIPEVRGEKGLVITQILSTEPPE